MTTVRKPPKVEDSEVEILTQDQVSAVLAALKGHALYPVVALALSANFAGLSGEILTLIVAPFTLSDPLKKRDQAV